MREMKTFTVNGVEYKVTDPIVDKLCPDFTESGAVTTCEPVEGYPLEVVSTLAPKPDDSYHGVITLKHCGKNILDIATAGVYHSNAAAGPYLGMKVTETGLRMELVKDSTNNWGTCGFCLGTVKELAGKTITVSGKAKTAFTDVELPWLQISKTNNEPTTVRENPVYKDGGNANDRKTLAYSSTHSGHAKATYTVTGEEGYKYIAIMFQLTYGGSGVVGDWTQWSDIQVEIGNNATAYEPYKGQTFTADLSEVGVAEGSYNWNTGVLINDSGEMWQHNLSNNTFTNIDTEDYNPLIVRSVPALPGTNTLYSDCGDTEVSGKADPVKIIEKLTNAILAQGGTV